jgi:hypothetical protein
MSWADRHGYESLSGLATQRERDDEALYELHLDFLCNESTCRFCKLEKEKNNGTVGTPSPSPKNGG